MALSHNLPNGLEEQHLTALKWFDDHAGETIAAAEIREFGETTTILVSPAKGIYKPRYTEYALSVKQTFKGPYADLDPERRSDGSWLYPYFQENQDPAQRDKEATNRGLMKCMEDGVPIGVLIQSRPKSQGVAYDVLGLARVIDWQQGYFYLEGYSSNGPMPKPISPSAAARARAHAERDTADQEPFDASDQTDQRESTIAKIVRRRGQAKFRRLLIAAYQGKCAVTGCDATEALEAAHITPYLGEETNHTQNGLLLRADVHNLFDLGLLTITPGDLRVRLAPSLQGTSYAELDGERINTPADNRHLPSNDALAQHCEWSGLVG